MHHIVSDAWSMGVLVREVTALYEAISKSQPPTLPELPIQYADFAHWQRGWLQGEVGETHLGYWTQQLARLPQMSEFPTDHPRPAVQSYHGAYHTQAFSKETTGALKALSNQQGVTLFMTLLSAYHIVLGHYSNRDEIPIGIDVANRNRAETEGLIGLFVNQLVLLIDQSGDLSFRQFLERVRELSLAGYAHQDLPFDKLVEALNPERVLSHNPLFQVMFGFQNTSSSTLELPGLKLSGGADVGSERSVFELSLYMVEKEQGIIGTWAYRTSLFELFNHRPIRETFRDDYQPHHQRHGDKPQNPPRTARQRRSRKRTGEARRVQTGPPSQTQKRQRAIQLSTSCLRRSNACVARFHSRDLKMRTLERQNSVATRLRAPIRKNIQPKAISMSQETMVKIRDAAARLGSAAHLRAGG